MKHTFHRYRVVVVSAFLMVSAMTGTQASGQESWGPPSAGPITTWTAPVCAKGELVIQPLLFYNRVGGSFDMEGNRESLPDGEKNSQSIQQLFFQYGLTDRLELAGQTVFQQNRLTQGGIDASSAGFGDSYLFLRYCLSEEQEIIPNIAAMVQLKLPTGKYQDGDPGILGADLMGSGSFDPGFGINLSKTLRPFMLHAEAIYNIPLERTIDGIETRFGNYLNYDTGFEYFLPQGWNLLVELNGMVQGKTKLAGGTISGTDSSVLAGAAGAGWSNDTVQMLAAWLRTLTGKNTDAVDSVVFTVVYALP